MGNTTQELAGVALNKLAVINSAEELAALCALAINDRADFEEGYREVDTLGNAWPEIYAKAQPRGIEPVMRLSDQGYLWSPLFGTKYKVVAENFHNTQEIYEYVNQLVPKVKRGLTDFVQFKAELLKRYEAGIHAKVAQLQEAITSDYRERTPAELKNESFFNKFSHKGLIKKTAREITEEQKSLAMWADVEEKFDHEPELADLVKVPIYAIKIAKMPQPSFMEEDITQGVFFNFENNTYSVETIKRLNYLEKVLPLVEKNMRNWRDEFKEAYRRFQEAWSTLHQRQTDLEAMDGFLPVAFFETDSLLLRPYYAKLYQLFVDQRATTWEAGAKLFVADSKEQQADEKSQADLEATQLLLQKVTAVGIKVQESMVKMGEEIQSDISAQGETIRDDMNINTATLENKLTANNVLGMMNLIETSWQSGTLQKYIK